MEPKKYYSLDGKIDNEIDHGNWNNRLGYYRRNYLSYWEYESEDDKMKRLAKEKAEARDKKIDLILNTI
jgi:hypothetical protein